MPNRKILSIFRKNKQKEPEKSLKEQIKQQMAEPLTQEDIQRIDERLEVLEKMYKDSEE